MSCGPCIHALAAAKVRAKRWDTRMDLHLGLETARRYFISNTFEVGTVSEAAETSGFSRAHFSRVFATTTGKTARQYLVNARIEIGSAILRNGGSVLEAASRSGYRDVSAFGRAFKRTRGMSPSEYRKEHNRQTSEPRT